MITLPQVTGNTLDLSVSPKFAFEHDREGAFPNGQSALKYIIDTEIKTGAWHDEILTTLPDNAVIVDVGMNVGLFSLYLESRNRKFYGIEPCGYHIDVAKELFEKFGFDATIYEGVLYSKDGMVTLWEAPENTTSNRVGAGAPTKVESRRLKTFLEENEIDEVDLLKIDVEGAEKAIILEDKTIGEALRKCKLIFIETHVGDAYMTVAEKNELVVKIIGFGFSCREAKRAGSYYFTRQT